MKNSLFSRLFLPWILVVSCSTQPNQRFVSLDPSESGVTFVNRLEPNKDLNIINNLYYYDGGGVAVADIDLDGYPDLFFVSNEGDHHLYHNNGDLTFRNIIDESGITEPLINSESTSWATGAAFADVNGDRYPDLFLVRSSFEGRESRHSLYINQGDGTFIDEADAWGVGISTYGTHVAFFDYDRDGDLDLYLLNHSFHSERSYGEAERLRPLVDPKAGDRLFENTGSKFIDITEGSGIQRSALGYGLGVAIADINLDGWPDIYVGNDFHENDYLYINQMDGTFRELAADVFAYTSNSSMGNDIADLNGDGLPDIISLDMMPSDRGTLMSTGGGDQPRVARIKEELGYQVHANHNTLQMNQGINLNGEPIFKEMGMLKGIARTDWSWSVLAADFTNSGHRDLYITNGIGMLPNDLDHIERLNQLDISTPESRWDPISDQEMEILKIMPTSKTQNVAFKNLGEATFVDQSVEWGLAEARYSNGTAWVDLDLDGDLDIITNNINDPASIYLNQTRQHELESSNFIKLTLEGNGLNSQGIGAHVTIWYEDQIQVSEHYLSRGFQSSVEPGLHFGLGLFSGTIDSIQVRWGDGLISRLFDIPSNTMTTIRQSEALESSTFIYALDSEHQTQKLPILSSIVPSWLPELNHTENDFDAFIDEPTLPFDASQLGPAIAVGDIDGNGTQDIFMGASHDYPASLWLQSNEGQFESVQQSLWQEWEQGEDADALMYDANGDGHLDLWIVRGGGQFPGGHPIYQDVLYINQGDGTLVPDPVGTPPQRVNGSVIAKSSTDPFLFIGGRSVVWSYGSDATSLLLSTATYPAQDVSESMLPEWRSLGMVTDATWADVTGDGRDELIVVGEWMPIQIFDFSSGEGVNIAMKLGFTQSSGYWQSVETADINQDGRADVFAGNLGLNTRLQPSKEATIELWVADFEQRGIPSGIIVETINNTPYPFEQIQEIGREFPSLVTSVESYSEYANASLNDLWPSWTNNQDQSQIQKKPLQTVMSKVWVSTETGYSEKELPVEIQSGPIRDWHIERLSKVDQGDQLENVHVLSIGNFAFWRPSLGAPQRANPMNHLIWNQQHESFELVAPSESGLILQGVFSNIHSISIKGSPHLLIGTHEGQSTLYKWNR